MGIDTNPNYKELTEPNNSETNEMSTSEQIVQAEKEASIIFEETETLQEEYKEIIENGVIDKINERDDIEKQNTLKEKLNNIARKSNIILGGILGGSFASFVAVSLSSQKMESVLYGAIVGLVSMSAGCIINGKYTGKKEAEIIKGSEEIYEVIKKQRDEEEKTNSNDDDTPSMNFLAGGGMMMNK